MDHNQRPQQREVMYCHQCENEWYRDEHGLECPECHSDFTEVIEANNDPREDEHHIPGEPEFRHDGGGFGAPAPDPDEDDIDNLRWEQTGPGTYRVRGRYNMDVPLNRQGQMQGHGQGQGGMGGGLMGMVGNLLQGMVGQQQGQGQQSDQHGQPEAPNSPDRAGSPQAGGQRAPSNGTHIRHGTGPGFSYTIATSSNANFNGNLFPRNAHGPQPFQPQPNHLDQMLAQMFMNVGAMPGQHGVHGHGPGMHNHPLHDHDPFGPQGGDGFMFGGPGGFANILNMFGGPPGQAGDAVYTQEALDRIMTQLMEQHQSGNAPGPASDAAIKSLPKRPVTAKDQGSEGKAECSICMDEVPLGEEVTELPCHHWFHHECVKAWLSEHDTCPHCRQGIMPKDANSAEGSRNPGQEPLNDMRSPEFARAGAVPGAFPFPQQGDGSRANPYTVPESPSGGSGQGRRGSGGGMFGRMREAFGGGGGGGSGSQGEHDTPRPRPRQQSILRNRYQRQRAQLPQVQPPRYQQQQVRVQRSQPALYYHPARPHVMLEHIPLSDPRHPIWTTTSPPPARRHSLGTPSPYTDPRRQQRSRSEAARDRALELAMELEPVRELRDARWSRRQRTSLVSGVSGVGYGVETTGQERRRRSRATRWPSGGSIRTLRTSASRAGSEDEAAGGDAPASGNPNPSPASTPEISAPSVSRRETLTLRHLPHEPASDSSSSISSPTTRRAPSFSQRLRRTRSTFSLRSRRTFHRLRSRTSPLSFARTKSRLRDRRSTFSLRASGRRHTLSTARASAADHLRRVRSELMTRFVPGRTAASSINTGLSDTPQDGGGGAQQPGLGRRLSRQLSRWNFGNPIPPSLRRGQGQRERGTERELERQGDGFDTDVQHVEHSLEDFDIRGGMSF